MNERLNNVDKGHKVALSWLPGHTRIRSNKKASVLSKKAAKTLLTQKNSKIRKYSTDHTSDHTY